MHSQDICVTSVLCLDPGLRADHQARFPALGQDRCSHPGLHHSGEVQCCTAGADGPRQPRCSQSSTERLLSADVQCSETCRIPTQTRGTLDIVLGLFSVCLDSWLSVHFAVDFHVLILMCLFPIISCFHYPFLILHSPIPGSQYLV